MIIKKKKILFRLFSKVFGGDPNHASAFILLLAFVPMIQATYGYLQMVMFICFCLMILWFVIRMIYILIFNKFKRAQIEGSDAILVKILSKKQKFRFSDLGSGVPAGSSAYYEKIKAVSLLSETGKIYSLIPLFMFYNSSLDIPRPASTMHTSQQGLKDAMTPDYKVTSIKAIQKIVNREAGLTIAYQREKVKKIKETLTHIKVISNSLDLDDYGRETIREVINKITDYLDESKTFLGNKNN